jgi:hypothetical protein
MFNFFFSKVIFCLCPSNLSVVLKDTIAFSVANPDNFDADPDSTSEKNLIRIQLYVNFLTINFCLKNSV